MIKLKSLIKEYFNNINQYRIPLKRYIKNMFKTEYNDEQLLLFNLTTDELIQSFLDKILSIKISYEVDYENNPHGMYDGETNEITINYNPNKYDRYSRYPRYHNYVDSVLFHELIHAINYHKKLWDKVTYDGLIFDDSYYGNEEEIRAYTSQIQIFLIQTLGMSKNKAIQLMTKYTTDKNSKYRNKWMKTYTSK